MPPKPFNILLIEPDLKHAKAIGDALLDKKYIHDVSIAFTLAETLAILDAADKFSKPSIILMEVDMPLSRGLELISYIKEHKDFKRIPVIAFSHLKRMSQVVDCYKRHINCYIEKPQNLKEYASALRSIIEFWHTFIQLEAQPVLS